MDCTYCFDKKYVAIIPNAPCPDKYFDGFINDMSGDNGKALEDWNNRYHEYWASNDYREIRNNLPTIGHLFLNEQTDYVKTGVYPCPECYLSPDGKGVEYP